MAIHMISWGPDSLTYEDAYNTYARRLFPWPDVEEPEWGGAWCVVKPGETSTPHSHEEKEMYFIVEGSGVLRIGDEHRRVGFGDTIFITPEREHEIHNDGDDRLLFLSIWWDDPGGQE
jgi:mannose-6-phosphate isomerase-like protein (cupin superfamily)